MIAQIENHQWPLSGPVSAAAATGAFYQTLQREYQGGLKDAYRYKDKVLIQLTFQQWSLGISTAIENYEFTVGVCLEIKESTWLY